MELKSCRSKESNFQMLRIVATFMVIILHLNNRSIGGALTYTDNNLFSFQILKLLESFSICAVNIFVILSGYFMVEKSERKVGKVIGLFSYVIFLQLFFTGISMVIHKDFALIHLFSLILPTNYYIILYCVLFLISPYINLLISKIDRATYKKLIITSIVLFSLQPTVMDAVLDIFNKDLVGVSTISANGSEAGYTIVNFILLYLIGGYIKKYEIEIKKSSKNKAFRKSTKIWKIFLPTSSTCCYGCAYYHRWFYLWKERCYLLTRPGNCL